ncbi:MAG TPA: hypothetical protein PKD37_07180 [Oligoflexia bacterium]|nr:hypothetical protein [Oligoflexia bacterium]
MIFFLLKTVIEELFTLLADMILSLSILFLRTVKLAGVLATTDVAKRDYFQYNQ